MQGTTSLQQRLIRWAGQSKLAELNAAEMRAAAISLGVSTDEVLHAVLRLDGEGLDSSLPPDTAFDAALRSYLRDGTIGANEIQGLLVHLREHGRAERSSLDRLLQLNISPFFERLLRWALRGGDAPTLSRRELSDGLESMRTNDAWKAHSKAAALLAFRSVGDGDRSHALGDLLALEPPDTFIAVVKWADDHGGRPRLAFDDFARGVAAVHRRGDVSARDDQAMLWAFSCLSAEERQRGLAHVASLGLTPTHDKLSAWAAKP